MADMLVRDPDTFDWLTGAPDRIAQSTDKEQLLASFERAVEAVDTREDKLNAVRRVARRELLRIGVGDLAGGRAIQYVAADLSILADVCLQKLIDILLPDLASALWHAAKWRWTACGVCDFWIGQVGRYGTQF